jgi:hypothetical protein
MEKFEIINGKWIKINKDRTDAIKIAAINRIMEYTYPPGDGYAILLYATHSLFLTVQYIVSEKDQYNRDLKILEKLLYNQ